MGPIVIGILLFIVGLLTGIVAPALLKSRRPYGIAGDVVASILAMLAFGLLEWVWLLPALGFTGWLAIAAAIGDPFFGALLVLWLMRKIKPAIPEDEE